MGSYKNCRKEFEYAVHVGRDLVPLKLEGSFEPSSWLGINVARKLYFDFSDHTAFHERVLDLCRELGSRGRVAMSEEAPNDPAGVKEWTEARVQQWLSEKSFTEVVHKGFAENSVDGAILLTLTDADLATDLNIASSVLRRRILKDIAELKQPARSATPVSHPSPIRTRSYDLTSSQKVVQHATPGSVRTKRESTELDEVEDMRAVKKVKTGEKNSESLLSGATLVMDDTLVLSLDMGQTQVYDTLPEDTPVDDDTWLMHADTQLPD